MSIFKRFFNTENNNSDFWNNLNNEEELQQIIMRSRETPQLIFKHSTRCPTSSTAKDRLERNWDVEDGAVEKYFLDLIRYRSISNKIADFFKVRHESPQVLLIKDGKAIYDNSHLGINVSEIKQWL